MEPYIGMIFMFGGNFAIRDYALCNGQLLSIAQYTALFSILGTTYGGNGQTNFALPDLRGRGPIHWGQGPGLSAYTIGQAAGTESFTISLAQMPQHFHAIGGSDQPGTLSLPAGAVMANSGNLDKEYAAAPGNTPMANTGNTGGSQAIAKRDPYLAVTFLIALQGIFPSRN